MRCLPMWVLMLLGPLAIVLASGVADAQVGQSSSFDRSTPGARVSPVIVSAHASRAVIAPGSQLAIAVVLDHAEHWHSWPAAVQDVLPKGFEFALRTNATLPDAPSWVTVGPVQWPEPSPAPVPNLSGEGPPTIEVPTYNGRAIAYIPLLVSGDAPLGAQTLRVEVFYQACDESTCLAPNTVALDVPWTIGSLEDVVAIPPSPDAEMFGGFDPSVFAAMQSGVAVDKDGGANGRTFFGVAVPASEGALGVLLLAVLATIGGFILNLTPCVLPVIPIKVLTISQHAGSPGRSLFLGLWMAAGVMAFWVGISLPVVLLQGFTDPSQIFGYWWLTLGIGVVIGLMGLGIMGLFTLNLPKAVYMVNPRADSAWGSFVFGVMTAVLGLPCFGFVAGALLAGAATLPALVIITIFTSLGVGMAAPYLVLSAWPRLVDRLPRTGPASELVKHVMGLLLLAAAAYFAGAGFLGYVSERPALASDLPWWHRVAHWWLVALFVCAAGAWLIVRTAQITKGPLRRFVFGAIGLMLGGGAVAYTVDTTQAARSDFWIPFDDAALEQALADNRVVVIDFTAEWCINCKALKATVLTRNPVKRELRTPGVVPMVADLTSNKAPGWEKLSDLGQTGIPLLVVFGPGLEEPWQSNAYTPKQVMDALARARVGAPSEPSAAWGVNALTVPGPRSTFGGSPGR